MVNEAQPTVQLKIVDGDGLFYTWRWEHELGAIQNIMVEAGRVKPALDALALSLPTPLYGETVDQALERSLAGAFTDREQEIGLSTALAASLIPYRLATELNEFLAQGLRPHVRIQASHATSQVPWEALHVDEGERFVSNSDVSVLPPATVRNAPERSVSKWDPGSNVVAVLDPSVPGATAALGSVLGPVESDSELAALVERLGERLVPKPTDSAFRRGDLNRDAIEPLLADAGRFLYVGHVTIADHGLDARLHLSCGPDTTGRAALARGHRPLTAGDIVLGHRPGATAGWRMPNRVALIACESGGEVRFAEPVGLVAAALHAGAQYVTATRWTLPTNAGIRRYATGAKPDTTVLPEAVVAVNDAHESPDPVAALNDWQRQKAERWEAEGRLEDSPIIWSAFATAYG
ncbi:CHAT domain-containing protein [Glycomyces harbinensis]|uniref:CHAT domain-containing protein n=1 Tax=Glycomyces harbinensis TaxID=58114 RepID=A0A1G7B5F9_9ACTN|nr:CHAT domain-containing protein [Glycomyces harbinensis]SDE21475.1 CHAT domain-containing protein [Glycomyces harbinensis]